jgi:hypothetical protein
MSYQKKGNNKLNKVGTMLAGASFAVAAPLMSNLISFEVEVDQPNEEVISTTPAFHAMGGGRGNRFQPSAYNQQDDEDIMNCFATWNKELCEIALTYNRPLYKPVPGHSTILHKLCEGVDDTTVSFNKDVLEKTVNLIVNTFPGIDSFEDECGLTPLETAKKIFDGTKNQQSSTSRENQEYKKKADLLYQTIASITDAEIYERVCVSGASGASGATFDNQPPPPSQQPEPKSYFQATMDTIRTFNPFGSTPAQQPPVVASAERRQPKRHRQLIANLTPSAAPQQQEALQQAPSLFDEHAFSSQQHTLTPTTTSSSQQLTLPPTTTSSSQQLTLTPTTVFSSRQRTLAPTIPVTDIRTSSIQKPVDEPRKPKQVPNPFGRTIHFNRDEALARREKPGKNDFLVYNGTLGEIRKVHETIRKNEKLYTTINCIGCMEECKPSDEVFVCTECPITYCEDCFGMYTGGSPFQCAGCKKPILKNKFMGTLIGPMPDGTMTVGPKEDITSISYDFPAGQQRDCHPQEGKNYAGRQENQFVKYDPKNPESQRLVVAGMVEAFQQGLTFTVGRSMTVGGNEERITFNDIHMKTNPGYGEHGVLSDPGHNKNVLGELKSKGIDPTTFKFV